MIHIWGPLVGAVLAVVAWWWSSRDARRERSTWEALLAPSTADGPRAAVEGRAAGTTSVEAPFSGRSCLAYHAEIIVREELGSTVRWRRLYEEGGGAFELVGDDGVTTRVDYTRGELVLPASLDDPSDRTKRRAETVYEGIPRLLPEHLESFVLGTLGDDRRAGFFAAARVFFDERVVVAEDAVVAAGPASRDVDGTVSLAPDASDVVVLGFGSLATERERVAASTRTRALFVPVVVGAVVAAMVELVVVARS